MADPVLGPKTSDDIPAELLRTEFIDSVERHNEADRNFKNLFCKTTRKDTVEVRQRSMVFQKSGADSTTPDFQHLEYQRITVPDPERYLCRPGLTRAAWEAGLASDEVREMHSEALDADSRFITQMVLQEMLTDGGWWDAAMTTAPPPFKMNTFATSEDHYLAANVAGVPAYAHWTNAKHHIQEHGYGFTGQGGCSVISFMNSEQGEQVENVADWVDATNTRMDTAVLERLQTYGLTPQFTVAGVGVVLEDWVPENYLLFVDSNVKPCHWHLTDNSEADNLMVLMHDDNVQYYGVGDYIRWGSAKVTLRGAGCCYYLDSATWTDPTGFEV